MELLGVYVILGTFAIPVYCFVVTYGIIRLCKYFSERSKK